jgi:hypothetical protein
MIVGLTHTIMLMTQIIEEHSENKLWVKAQQQRRLSFVVQIKG